MPTTYRFRPARRLGPYQPDRPLGLGSFAEVWLAHPDAAIAAPPVAVKLPHQAVDFGAVRRAVVVWARLSNHPNVLRLLVADKVGDQVVIVSEYAAGGSLKDWWRANGSAVAAALELRSGVLDGLGHLRAQGVIHRDVKPENVLMQWGAPRLADFGIAWSGGGG